MRYGRAGARRILLFSSSPACYANAVMLACLLNASM